MARRKKKAKPFLREQRALLRRPRPFRPLSFFALFLNPDSAPPIPHFSTVDRRMHDVLVPLGERQHEEMHRRMEAQLLRLPTQVCLFFFSRAFFGFFSVIVKDIFFSHTRFRLSLPLSLSVFSKLPLRSARCSSRLSWTSLAGTWQRRRRAGLLLLLLSREKKKRPQRQPRRRRPRRKLLRLLSPLLPSLLPLLALRFPLRSARRRRRRRRTLPPPLPTRTPPRASA